MVDAAFSSVTTVVEPALSPASVRAAIGAARSVDELALAAGNIRHLTLAAMERGESTPSMTRQISQFNDLVTEQLVRRTAAELGLDLGQACWLAFGSQGRSEQTLATDQDNGLVLDSDDAASTRARWLELGQRVNLALDACGYSLCRGRVMAGQHDCCLTVAEWCTRFDRWMEHGAPEDLLNASIYFDVRGLVGRRDLATGMRHRITARAAGLPRFLKQMAENALRYPAPLNWLGTVRTTQYDGQAMFDLKMSGTALFVEAARLYALAHGIADVTGTVERLDAASRAMHVPDHETQRWRHGFESLQRLRLQLQLRSTVSSGNPNLVALRTLGKEDVESLRHALRAARLLQQRIELDYRR
jgi:CBS domain-containing protein